MKTSELTGALLDFWVAMAEGEKPYYDNKDEAPHAFARGDHIGWLKHGEFGSAKEVPKYSSQWEVGGPIIERDQIFLQPPSEVHYNGGPNHGWKRYDHWRATVSSRTRTLPPKNEFQEEFKVRGVGRGAGETPLLAAMRAKVASHYGDEVPDDHEAAQPAAEP